MENQEVYHKLAGTFQAYQNCKKSNNQEWEAKHYQTMRDLLNDLPHGSGLDGQWMLDENKTNDKRLVLTMSYHPMNEAGYYDGYIDFTLTIIPGWNGAVLSITGNFGKKQDIKEYLYDTLS